MFIVVVVGLIITIISSIVILILYLTKQNCPSTDNNKDIKNWFVNTDFIINGIIPLSKSVRLDLDKKYFEKYYNNNYYEINNIYSNDKSKQIFNTGFQCELQIFGLTLINKVLNQMINYESGKEGADKLKGIFVTILDIIAILYSLSDHKQTQNLNTLIQNIPLVSNGNSTPVCKVSNGDPMSSYIESYIEASTIDKLEILKLTGYLNQCSQVDMKKINLFNSQVQQLLNKTCTDYSGKNLVYKNASNSLRNKIVIDILTKHF